MRPIDADELRKHAVETYQGNGVELEPIMMVPLSVIDNAPTIPLFVFRENGRTNYPHVDTSKGPDSDYLNWEVKNGNT